MIHRTRLDADRRAYLQAWHTHCVAMVPNLDEINAEAISVANAIRGIAAAHHQAPASVAKEPA